jgi:hypothetical protein
LKRNQYGWQYRADLGVERIGYRNDGEEDNLPSKIDDPAVSDWDGDGHPGATLQLTIPLLPSGELYVVQRGQSILTGHGFNPERSKAVSMCGISSNEFWGLGRAFWQNRRI